LKKSNKKGAKFDYYLWGGYGVISQYDYNSTYVEKYCVPKKFCYKFIIQDAYGDGMCCQHGEGGWKLSYGGRVIRDSKFEVSTENFPKYKEFAAPFGKNCKKFGY